MIRTSHKKRVFKKKNTSLKRPFKGTITVSCSKLQNKHPFILSFFICFYIYYNIYKKKLKKDPKYPTFIHLFFNTYEKSGGRTPNPIHQIAKQDLTHQVFPKELARSIMADLHARSRRIQHDSQTKSSLKILKMPLWLSSCKTTKDLA